MLYKLTCAGVPDPEALTRDILRKVEEEGWMIVSPAPGVNALLHTKVADATTAVVYSNQVFRLGVLVEHLLIRYEFEQLAIERAPIPADDQDAAQRWLAQNEDGASCGG